jgi:hypothetical protein
MAEPTSTTTVASLAAGVSIATLLPGIDGNAIIGAFAGAALVALNAKDVSMVSRVIYLLVSWVVGYMAAPEVASRAGLHQTGLAAFLASAFAIAVTVNLMERIKTIDLNSWLRRGGS